jgi:hypothetical protein
MDFVKQLRWEARSIVGQRPLLCRSLIRKSGEYPTSQTEIVIEGFPRTGNTFAVIAFQSVQPRIVSIAHHVHAPAPVIDAVRRGTPAIVLIREPEEAVLSFVLRLAPLTIGQGLRSYVRFYSPLVRYRDDFVLGRFDDVVRDFGSVIAEVNSRYGRDFVPFEHTEANLSRVIEELDVWDRNTFGEGAMLEQGRARPSEAREELKEELRPRYRASGFDRLRRRAERLYETFTARRGTAVEGY